MAVLADRPWTGMMLMATGRGRRPRICAGAEAREDSVPTSNLHGWMGRMRVVGGMQRERQVSRIAWPLSKAGALFGHGAPVYVVVGFACLCTWWLGVRHCLISIASCI
jgi:hypothetical protein